MLDVRLVGLVFVLLQAVPAVQPSGPEGQWVTRDDRTGRPRALVRLTALNGGELSGVIECLFPAPDQPPDPVCERCKGPRRGQRITGMQILGGARRQDDRWVGGRLLDPENGKEYTASVWLDGPSRLKVRGHWGPFHRTQTWSRTTNSEGSPMDCSSRRPPQEPRS
jgi:hypothetical protein